MISLKNFANTKIFSFPFHRAIPSLLTSTNLSAHPIIRSPCKVTYPGQNTRHSLKNSFTRAKPFPCKADDGQGFSLKSGWIRARRFIRRQIVVCHFYVCSRTRGRREGWLKSATASSLARNKPASKKKERIVCHITWARIAQRVAQLETHGRVADSFFPSLFHSPFLPPLPYLLPFRCLQEPCFSRNLEGVWILIYQGKFISSTLLLLFLQFLFYFTAVSRVYSNKSIRSFKN